jgi:hypothetical protein
VKSMISGGDHCQFSDAMNGDKSLTTKHRHRKRIVYTSRNGSVTASFCILAMNRRKGSAKKENVSEGFCCKASGRG